MSNECLDVVIAEIYAAGLIPVVKNDGKHIKIFWPAPLHYGMRQITVARSASDKRAAMNNRALVRRILRKDGFLKEKVHA